MSSIATVTHVSPLLTGDDILKPTTQEGTAVGEVTDGDKKKEKKEKKEKANLPAKHFKGMVFGYWHLMRLKEDSIITEEVYSKALVDYLKPFASVTDQTTLYESFDNDFKMLSKDLKKMIKDHHKPPKVKKTKKAKAVKDKKTKTDSKHKDDQNDLVSRIVDAALTSTEPSIPSKPKRKYNRKKSDNTQTKDSCIGCETGRDNDDDHRDPNTNNFFPNCCCAPNKEELDDKGDADKGDAEKGDAEKGDADKGDAETGDAETGDAEKGDAETGDAETGDAEKELDEEELDEEELDEEERDVKEFIFKDGFVCLYDPNDLVLYDKDSHEPITSHSLQRISLPDGSSMLLDNHNYTYTV